MVEMVNTRRMKEQDKAFASAERIERDGGERIEFILPVDLAARLREVAKAEDRSVAGELRWLVRQRVNGATQASPADPDVLYNAEATDDERDAVMAALVESKPQADGLLLNAEQAAELLGVPKTWLLAQARRDAVPHVRLGRYVRFQADELEAWARDRARGPRRSDDP